MQLSFVNVCVILIDDPRKNKNGLFGDAATVPNHSVLRCVANMLYRTVPQVTHITKRQISHLIMTNLLSN